MRLKAAFSLSDETKALAFHVYVNSPYFNVPHLYRYFFLSRWFHKSLQISIHPAFYISIFPCLNAFCWLRLIRKSLRKNYVACKQIARCFALKIEVISIMLLILVCGIFRMWPVSGFSSGYWRVPSYWAILSFFRHWAEHFDRCKPSSYHWK